MLNIKSIFFIQILIVAVAISQVRDFRTHRRGMLHQTVFNTGELGRAYDRGDNGMIREHSSMEWPPNSSSILNTYEYKGSHNSLGGGLYISGFKNGVNNTVLCGAVTTAGNGQSVPVAGVYVNPGLIVRTENYPLLSNGDLNPAYNPNEAEEIITTQWTTIGLNIAVTRTSRTWSFPGYNSFIIYEYDIVNNDTVDYTDAFVGWGYGFLPSMFGFERTYSRWAEGDSRSKNTFARFDLSRWMTYNHDRDGSPELQNFDLWSQPDSWGGLNSPQAVGFFPLHYDYQNLSTKDQTNYPKTSDSSYVWDTNWKMKQPYTNRYENANIDITKLQTLMDVTIRKTSPFYSVTDSIAFVTKFRDTTSWKYWKGRTKPSWTLGYSQPASHGYVFGPYNLPKGIHLRFALAEVVGYGAGIASDSVYKDLGGSRGNEMGTLGFNPIPSWYKELNYPNASLTSNIVGSNYLQSHELPWYVTPGVVSIRDAADRAIQLYTGNPLVKWDSLQFDPKDTPPTGMYNTIPISIPAPVVELTVKNDSVKFRKDITIRWGNQCESFSTPRLHSTIKYYTVLKSDHPLGRWIRIDSVGIKDPRYFENSQYSLSDTSVWLNDDCSYVVVSVDSLGNQSGFTNLISSKQAIPLFAQNDIKKNIPTEFLLMQNYPNPFNPSTWINYHLSTARHILLTVYDVIGREVLIIVNEMKEAGNHSVEFNGSSLPSGIYFARLDNNGRSQMKKMVLIK